jgi:hypothetical protein
MRQRLADGKRSIISYSGSCRHLIDMDRHNVRLYLTYSFLRDFGGRGCGRRPIVREDGAVPTPTVLQVYCGVGRGIGVGRDRGVSVDLGVGRDGVAVGVLQDIGSHPLILTVSTRQPSFEPLLSLAMRQRNSIRNAIDDILTTVVMKPAELPLQA